MRGPPPIVITGTDTGVGKTVFAAALTRALGGYYWKPVQTGADSDSRTVAALGGVPAARILPEAYRLKEPLSPHRAAELEGVSIAPKQLAAPEVDGALVIEGAGGVLVPLTRHFVFADLFAHWGFPVVVVARTSLGTINHSLLSIEALRARGARVLGLAFVGEAMDDNERTIAELGGVRRLGRLPMIATLHPEALSAAFAQGFDVGAFR